MNITLPNGMKIEGTPEQVKETLRTLGVSFGYLDDEKYYYSESKGPVLIKDMNTYHLRNAILKVYSEWVANLHAITSPQELVRNLMEGIPMSNKNWYAMVREYAKRKE